MLGPGEVPEFDLLKGRLVCEFASHPRTLLYCCGRSLLRVELRGAAAAAAAGVPGAPAPKPDVAVLQVVPEEQQLRCLAPLVAAGRAAQRDGGFLCAAATNTHVLLLDIRTPHKLHLMWRHNMQAEPPSVMQLQLVPAQALAPTGGGPDAPSQQQQGGGGAGGGWHSQQHELWLSQQQQQPSQQQGASQLPPSQLGSQAARAGGSGGGRAPSHVQLPRLRGLIALGNLGLGELQCLEFEVSAPLGVLVVPADERREQPYGELRWRGAEAAAGAAAGAADAGDAGAPGGSRGAGADAGGLPIPARAACLAGCCASCPCQQSLPPGSCLPPQGPTPGSGTCWRASPRWRPAPLPAWQSPSRLRHPATCASSCGAAGAPRRRRRCC